MSPISSRKIVPCSACSNFPVWRARRAGKRTLLVPEQFRFDQLRRNCGTVQSNERTRGSRTAFMQSARNQFFARASFSQNANSRLARRHALDLGHDFAHDLRSPNDFVLAQALPKLPVFRFQTPQFEHILHCEQKLFRGDRFFQKVERPKPRGANRHFNVRLARHHDHRNRDALRPEVFEKRKPIFAGHDHVGEDQIKVLRLGKFECLERVVANRRFVARQAECARQARPECWVRHPQSEDWLSAALVAPRGCVHATDLRSAVCPDSAAVQSRMLSRVRTHCRTLILPP